jgi:hypothetical protein
MALLMPVGGRCIPAEPPGGSRIEDATPNVRRFICQSGYEVSFPGSWRVLQREGFDLFIDKLGGVHEAATLSFGAVGVSPRAREAIVADLAGDGARFVAGYLATARKRFPDAQVVRSGPTVLGNFPAVEVVLTYSISNPGIRMEVLGWLIVALKDGKLIRVQYEGTGIPRKVWMKEAAAILSSFMYR